MSAYLSIAILLAAFVSLLVIVLLLYFGRKRRWLLVLGVGGLVTYGCAQSLLTYFPLLPWTFDSLRGWELRVPVELDRHTVTLVQQLGTDFYESYFEVQQAGEESFKILIHADDDRWWFPDVVRQDGKIYFVRGSGKITERTSFVDPAKNVVYSRYYERTHTLPY